MSVNLTEALINGLRDARIWSSDQSALALTGYTAVTEPNPLADFLKNCGPLSSYQIRKIRHNRIADLTLGNFVISEKIGEGGMGKVYKATSNKLGRVVALKVVRTHLMSNKTVLRRYKREAAAAAALNHPNIVRLLDADEVDGRYYLAMEFVDGSDLARLVKEYGPLAWQEAAEYCRQAALGLQHAHDRGLIHRDIKPSNLLVSGERALPGTDGVAHLKILDMGLVRSILDDDDVSRTELTRDGTVVGTPDYMAPEQAKNSSKVDARADLYSLGATLFYLLKGQQPFPDGSPIDKLLRHQLDPPPDLNKSRPDVPKALVAIVNKLLMKNPDDRYQRASDLAAALLPFTPSAEAGQILSTQTETVTLDLPASSIFPQPGERAINAAGATNILDAVIVDAEIVESTNQKPKAISSQKQGKVPTAKKIIRPQPFIPNDGNSESLPGSEPAATRPATNTPTKTSTPVYDRGSRTPSPRTQYRKQAVDSNRKVVAMVIAGVLAIMLLVAAIYLLSNSNGKASKPSQVKTSSPIVPQGNGGTTTTPPKETPAPATSFLRTDIALADQAVAAAMIYPQQHFKRNVYESKTNPHQQSWLNWLNAKNGFEAMIMDRVTVNILPDQTLLAFGEGSRLNDSWFLKLKDKFEVNEFDRGLKSSFFFHAKGSPKPLGVYFDPGAIVVGSNDRAMVSANSIRKYANRMSNNRSAQNVSPIFEKYLPKANDTNPPLLTFVATDRFRMPDSTRDKLFFDYGVSYLIVTVRIHDDDFEVEAIVVGESAEKMQSDFLSLGLPVHLIEKYAELQPFVGSLTTVTPEVGKVDGKASLKINVKWPIDQLNSWMESLLGSAPKG